MKSSLMEQPFLFSHGVRLVVYGILNEGSDVRAHVSIVNKAIYVFETVNGKDAVKNKTEKDLRFIWLPGVIGPTAAGWIVPIDSIRDVRKVSVTDMTEIKDTMTTSEKGSVAVDAVIKSLNSATFPLWIEATESTDATIQIKGTDVVLAFKKRIQVKCDWKCGERPHGTGNVFLQYAERNPLGAK